MTNALLNLANPWGYVLVAALVAGEAALFVGLVLPGETAAFIGGVLAYQGRVDLKLMLVVGCLAAIVGDTIGYQVGKTLGPRMRQGRLGRVVGRERWDRASDFVRSRGGRAVFLGRWIGVLRALVPGLAGASGIPYRVFLFFNVLGGITWATCFILLGYIAGSSWRSVEHVMGQATLVVVGGLVFIAILVLATRWVSSHRDEIAGARDSFLERPLIARQRSRFRRQIDFMHRRLDPRGRFGLYLTIGLVIAIVGAYVFGAILQDVVAHDELVVIDRPITLWMVHHRSAWLDTTMEVVTFFASAAFAIPVAILAALAGWYLKKSVRWPVLFVLAVGGTELIFNLVKVLVGRTRPNIHPLIHAPGMSFPSGHTMTAIVLYGSIAYMATKGRSWKSATWVWMATVLISCLVGVSRIYLGAHWFTDVLGSIFLGAFWLTVSIIITSLLEARDGAVRVDQPAEIGSRSTKERAS